MRRYGVRFLVALLTFGIGLALSSLLGVFGLFRTAHEPLRVFVSKPRCPKKESVRTQVRVQSYEAEPILLSYVKAPLSTAERGNDEVVVLIENRSGKTITSYHIAGSKTLTGRPGHDTTLDQTGSVILKPGQSLPVILPPVFNTAAMLQVARVEFEDGTTWRSPGYAEIIQ